MKPQHFERLYEEHSQGVFGFLAYRTGNAVLAEELLGETFKRVLAARRPPARRRASEKAWIYSIAVDRLRDAAARPTRQSVMPALSVLGDEEREALSLRYGGGLSLKDIATVVGEPRSTVEGRIHRGLKQLRPRSAGAGNEIRRKRGSELPGRAFNLRGDLSP
jgi:DNA-directed RNA polymerase specialized sigma24 family protein